MCKEQTAFTHQEPFLKCGPSGNSWQKGFRWNFMGKRKGAGI